MVGGSVNWLIGYWLIRLYRSLITIDPRLKTNDSLQGLDNFNKFFCNKRSAAHQSAIYIGTAEYFFCIIRFHTAAVKNGYLICHFSSILACQYRTKMGMHFLCLLRTRRFTGPDSPDRFIGDDHRFYFPDSKMEKRFSQLLLHKAILRASLPYVQWFAATK